MALELEASPPAAKAKADPIALVVDLDTVQADVTLKLYQETATYLDGLQTSSGVEVIELVAFSRRPWETLMRVETENQFPRLSTKRFAHVFADRGAMYVRHERKDGDRAVGDRAVGDAVLTRVQHRRDIRQHVSYPMVQEMMRRAMTYIAGASVLYPLAGNTIAIRGSEVSISLVGHDADSEELHQFEVVDAKHNLRGALTKELKGMVNGPHCTLRITHLNEDRIIVRPREWNAVTEIALAFGDRTTIQWLGSRRDLREAQLKWPSTAAVPASSLPAATPPCNPVVHDARSAERAAVHTRGMNSYYD